MSVAKDILSFSESYGSRQDDGEDVPGLTKTGWLVLTEFEAGKTVVREDEFAQNITSSDVAVEVASG
jgi:hypothetical protein